MRVFYAGNEGSLRFEEDEADVDQMLRPSQSPDLNQLNLNYKPHVNTEHSPPSSSKMRE